MTFITNRLLWCLLAAVLAVLPISSAVAAGMPQTGGSGSTDQTVLALQELSRSNGGRPADILAYVNRTIAPSSRENAVRMLAILEEAQQKALPQLQQEYENLSPAQTGILAAWYARRQENGSMEAVTDNVVRALLLYTRSAGYKVETTEGMFFPIIDYEAYARYLPSVTPDWAAYIAIMSAESAKMPAKDAALKIGWDELIRRALLQEKFLAEYPQSDKAVEVRRLYRQYFVFVLFGCNNTPLFAYETQIMNAEALATYRGAVAVRRDGRLLETIGRLLAMTEKSGGRLTGEADSFRKQTVGGGW